MPKYIAILGSIMSGLGKGVLSASIGKMLKSSSYTVSMLKFDGYLNVDCGTMNPFRHGEVFVLSDGSEVDVDFGTYERFLDISLDGNSSLTGGKIFSSIIRKERKGDYLGRDVQFIPHVTDYIIEHIRRNASNSDISLIEVGGTVGDIENSYFIEALRQLSRKDDVLFIQLTHLPDLYGELKTKPTQQANKILLRMGITPHIIIARTNKEMDIETKKKIASYCNVEERDVFNDLEVGNVYELPLFLEKEGLHNALARHLKIDVKPQLQAWKERASRINRGKEVKIGVVGKYVKQVDSYASLREALVHAGTESNAVPIVEFIDAEDITEDKLRGYDGVIIPGGFGKRGIDGKMKAI
ncbi:MAG: CTP synthase, partial [Methanobacteriota archaeon]